VHSRKSPSKDITAPPSAASSNPPPTTEAPVPTEPASAKTQAATTAADRTPDALDRSLTDIELRLSRMVAEPPGQWNTESLARETEELLAQAQTADERDAVNSMLAKLDRFEAIGRRYQENPAVSRQPSALSQTPADSREPTANSSKYDAAGILRPVVSKRPGAPQFALVNDRGQVISFVTPTPDVNLQPYLGHRVGVTGTRGFISEFQRAHVTAGRVTPLSERILR
jgi:hypothetical protein